MADICDDSDKYIENVIDDGIAAAMRMAADIPAGEAGECDGCGLYYKRIVNGMCAQCRMFYLGEK